MLPQPHTDAQHAAEEAEGVRLRALFTADINAHAAAQRGHKRSALELLLEHPTMAGRRNQFYAKYDLYSARSDLKEHYSSGQIAALCAALTAHSELDFEPAGIFGMFQMFCLAAQTHPPPKLNDGKKRVNLHGVPLSKFL